MIPADATPGTGTEGAPARSERVDRVAAALLETPHIGDSALTSAATAAHLVDALQALLLPTGRLRLLDVQAQVAGIHEQLQTLTNSEVADAFVDQLPDLQRRTRLDIDAAYRGDPAATSHAEIVACYPGIRAITIWRAASALHTLNVAIVPRMITEHVHSLTGIDIHPAATIGDSLFIDHGTGVVIGETAVIGDRVRIYQGVTLGARSFPLDADGNPIKGLARHPIICDDVTIYAGATILGRVTIGAASIIGGNVQVTRDVPPANRVVGKDPTARPVFEAGDGI